MMKLNPVLQYGERERPELWHGTTPEGSGRSRSPHCTFCGEKEQLQTTIWIPTILLNPACLTFDEVHHDVFTETQTGRKVCLAVRNFSHLFYELDQIIIVCQHKSIDDDPRTAALRDFGQRGLDDHRIETHRVLIKPAPFATLFGGAVGRAKHLGIDKQRRGFA